jgi:hypothetical protein
LLKNCGLHAGLWRRGGVGGVAVRWRTWEEAQQHATAVAVMQSISVPNVGNCTGAHETGRGGLTLPATATPCPNVTKRDCGNDWCGMQPLHSVAAAATSSRAHQRFRRSRLLHSKRGACNKPEAQTAAAIVTMRRRVLLWPSLHKRARFERLTVFPPTSPMIPLGLAGDCALCTVILRISNSRRN